MSFSGKSQGNKRNEILSQRIKERRYLKRKQKKKSHRKPFSISKINFENIQKLLGYKINRFTFRSYQWHLINQSDEWIIFSVYTSSMWMFWGVRTIQLPLILPMRERYGIEWNLNRFLASIILCMALVGWYFVTEDCAACRCAKKKERQIIYINIWIQGIKWKV